ncbi:nuclear-pore anchor [Argentina anserina]|uniref:nuclear-pore anchor n=1 Tax=Argentina anserina TaxID=57926 RepID=UPI002176645B|nr:nuclear-pore anchor [Potentilla anserina]
MPLFVSDEEFSCHQADAAWVAEKADSFIRNLYTELDTVKAQNDAASITAEQTCSLLEQKYLALCDDYSKLEAELAQLKSSFDERLSELAEVQSEKRQLNLQAINKDSEIEMLKTEVSELHKSKRQLMEIVEQKDEDISAKNVTVQSYLEKIVKSAENAAQREARLSEAEAELARTKDSCTHLSQEKELIERHNVWLNDELAAKVDSLIKLRRSHADIEAEMSFKLSDVERKFNDCSSSLNWNKERVRELEAKVTTLQEELRSSKDTAAANEERSNAEISTINKLVELYKESSEEWSKKAGELEGVIKALETHLSQVEHDYKERLEREVSVRSQFEKEAADLKTKLEKCEAEIETSRKANEPSLLPVNSSSQEMWLNSLEHVDMAEVNGAIVPKIPVDVSGTALAASLLRDGWSLAKMYAKYQEAVDAMHHEQLGRKESEAILQRVLYEIEQKAEVIMDERVEHERMAEAYSVINQKLQDSVSEQDYLEKIIMELKADIRRHERDYSFAQKEIADLQREVTILLKECRDIQLRGSSSGHDSHENTVVVYSESDTEKVISEHLLTFKDINGLVQQNAQFRSLVRNLTDQLENREHDFKEKFEMELKKHTEEASSRVEAVLRRAEEQGQMIESLHTSVAMYKRLYEEEHTLNSSSPHLIEAAPEERRSDVRHLLESSQEASRKALDNAAERVKCLEQDVAKARCEIISLRSERDNFSLDANIAREKLESFMKEFEHQRNETNGILARNIEFSQLIVDYQRKLRECSESVQTAEELSRKFTMEVSRLKQEKEILQHAEKRASDEVRSLSERIYRLQASLETIQSTQQVREEARAAERRKHEEYIEQKEREWADAKRELLEEKNNALSLAHDRDQTIKNASKQVEEMRKDLSNALHAAASAESRAAVAEARVSDLEKRSSSSDIQVVEIDGASGSASLTGDEAVVALRAAKDEIKNLKDEMQANKDHMLQYKSIAQVNEDALKQMEFAHDNFKIEAEKLKKSLDAEVLSLKERVSELENELTLKSQELASAAAGKEEALFSALAEISSLKEETSAKTSQTASLEIQLSTLKEHLEKEHQRWRTAQANYERQVILQSETIQELTKTSQALAVLQQEASEMRKLNDALKSENDELKSKWDVDKVLLEESASIAEKKYNEINEQNKLLHNQLEALHIRLAERNRGSFGISGSTEADTSGDAGLQTVISYLRRTKEITETEISLLKQEKLRLQSQLESALKASEAAQASLRAERASSMSMLFSEEELKSLQLQVREINLLRESNIQLREENKHNFEECQKLHDLSQKASVERHNLERLLRDRQIEVEACKNDIEIQKMEKNHLEKKLHELLERYRNINVEDYDRTKAEHQQMQLTLKEKDSHIEEVQKLLSEKLEIVSSLEKDIANVRSELTEKDRRINDMLQAEASLKSEAEKQRRIGLQFKRKYEMYLKEKEDLQKQKDELQRHCNDLQRQRDDLVRQLDEKQAKRSFGDPAAEHALKEEKDQKIQTLQKMMERQKEAMERQKEDLLRNEKANRKKTENAVLDSLNKIEQDKITFKNELEKHKQAVKQLSDEQEKLKLAKDGLPEGTSVVQHLSGATLDDRASAYFLACENYERVAHSTLNELGAGGVPADTPIADAPSVSTAPAQAATVASSITPTAVLPSKTTDETERRLSFPKRNFEPRKPGRKLVRPRLVRPEEPQGDVEMSETEGSQTLAKHAASTDAEVQGIAAPTQPLLRKRQASSSQFESQEESINQGDAGPNVTAPVSKKPKGSDSPLTSEGPAPASLESLGNVSATEEAFNVEFPPGSNEEGAVDADKEDIENTVMKVEEPIEQQFDDSSQPESQLDKNIVLEDVDGSDVKETVPDGGAKDNQMESDNQQPSEIGGDREEGELLPEVSDLEGGDTTMASPGMEEGQSEPITTPRASPSRVDDDDLAGASAVEISEENCPEVLNEEKTNEVDVPEETAEASDKSNDGIDQSGMETDLAAEAASVIGDASVTGESASASTTTTEVGGSKQASTSATTEVEETRQVSPSTTTINILEKARQGQLLRQRGLQPLAAPPAPNRGRGRPPQRARARAVRRTLRGRGPPSGDQV